MSIPEHFAPPVRSVGATSPVFLSHSSGREASEKTPHLFHGPLDMGSTAPSGLPSIWRKYHLCLGGFPPSRFYQRVPPHIKRLSRHKRWWCLTSEVWLIFTGGVAQLSPEQWLCHTEISNKDKLNDHKPPTYTTLVLASCASMYARYIPSFCTTGQNF
jgi:hypothetical protein